jgi:hypothetical protein
MRPGLPSREDDDVAFAELLLAVRRAERGLTANDEEPLLVRVVQVIGPQALSGLQLVQAPAEQLGAEASPHPAVLASPARAVLDAIPLVALKVEDVHGREPTR